MNAKELFSFLATAIPARKPVLITGAPGIGKTEICHAVARLLGLAFQVTTPSIEDPTVPAGLPFVVNGNADFLPFGALRRAKEATAEAPLVWLIDDLGQASPATQAGYMTVIDRVRTGDLPHVALIAATNRRTDKAGVSGVLEPVKSRFASIVELVPDLDSWCAWAIDSGMAPELIAFLRFKPDLLSAFKASADLTNSPTPRTWAHAAAWLALPMADSIKAQAIAGAVGDGAAAELLAFMRLFAALPSIDAILNDADTAEIPDQPATLYAVSTALASRVTPENFAMIAKYVDRMVSAQRGEFSALCVRDCLRRCPDVTKTAAFIKLATGKYGKLVSGKV